MEIYTLQTIEPFFYTNLIHSTPQGFHQHTFWEFTMIITGEALNVMLNEQDTQLARGDIMLFRPHDCHFIRPLSTPKNYTHRDIYIPDEIFHNICNTLKPSLYEDLKTAQLPTLFHIDETELNNLNSHFNYFFNLSRRTITADAIHIALVSYLLGLYLKNKSLTKKAIPNWLSNLLIELQNPNTFILPISEIIEKTHYSHSYVCSMFKFYLNKSLLEHLTDIRMHHAASLLSSPNYTVLQVAGILGYTSPNNFIAAFKKRFNVTPKQWQKSHIKIT